MREPEGERSVFDRWGQGFRVTAVAEDLDTAVKNAYKGVDLISFEGMHYRRDIGLK